MAWKGVRRLLFRGISRQLGLSRFLWKGSFLLYFGTVGSTVVKAPDITIILTVTSLPLLLVRLWLSRHEKTEKAGER